MTGILTLIITLIASLLPPSLFVWWMTAFMAPYTDFSKDSDYTTRLCAIAHPLNPPAPLGRNPYEYEKHPPNQTGYCAVEIDRIGLSYFLHNVSSESEGHRRGWAITHKGQCGVCSTLRDLAVYLHHRDLTGPVRKCSIFSWLKDYFCF